MRSKSPLALMEQTSFTEGVINLTDMGPYANEIRYFADCVLQGVPCDKVKAEELKTVDKGAFLHHLCAGGILSVLAEICDNIADTHYASFKSRRNDLYDICLIDIAALHHIVKRLEAIHRLRAILVHLKLTVMGDDAV